MSRCRQHAGGLAQEEIARRGWAIGADEAVMLIGRATPCSSICASRGSAPSTASFRLAPCPYPELAANVRSGGMLNELARATGKRIVFYCAFGERSAMAVQAAQEAGLASARTSKAAWMPGARPAAQSVVEAKALDFPDCGQQRLADDETLRCGLLPGGQPPRAGQPRAWCCSIDAARSAKRAAAAVPPKAAASRAMINCPVPGGGLRHRETRRLRRRNLRRSGRRRAAPP